MNFDPGLLSLGVLFTVCGVSLLTISRQPKFRPQDSVFVETRQGNRDAIVMTGTFNEKDRMYVSKTFKCVIDETGKPDLQLTGTGYIHYDKNNKPR